MTRRIDALLGPIAAVLLGAAGGFFCFAMPAALIGRLLDPAVIGGRLPLAILLGLVIGIATWLAFAWLDRAGRPAAAYAGALEGEADAAPILRRADVHPDAPPRRPIFAGSDLGVPLDLVDPLPADWREPAARTGAEAAFDRADFTPFDHPAPAAEMSAESPILVVPPQRREARAPTAAESLQPLAALMARLEAGLARKALVLAGAEPNVTALKREIRPIGGTLRAAVEELQQRTAQRR